MDTLELHQHLGAAYHREQVQGDRAGAVAMMRAALSTPEAKTIAQEHRKQLGEVLSARSLNGRSGCHVTKVSHDLLSAALKDAG